MVVKYRCNITNITCHKYIKEKIMSIISSCFRYAKAPARKLLSKVGKRVQEKQIEKLKEKLNDPLCDIFRDYDGPTFIITDTGIKKMHK